LNQFDIAYMITGNNESISMALLPKELKQLAKFLAYVLGRRPDEFGLIPDDQGYVKIKNLLQALHEDDQWRKVRQADLNTLVATERPASIEIRENTVRATIREQLPSITTPDRLPKLLFSVIRRRAYPKVHSSGIQSGPNTKIVLSRDEVMAKRIGKRLDNEPVLLTVNTEMAQATGSHIQQFGEHLFLSDYISVEAFRGPPLPKEKPTTAEPQKAENKEIFKPKTPGSYFPDFNQTSSRDPAEGTRPRRDEKKWKQERRRARREKSKQRGSSG
jgi:putative RNA 2'-phosphotransferase